MKRADASGRALSEEELDRFCEYLYRRTGMTFGESKRYYIDRRVAARMLLATGDVDFRDYFGRLRSERGELEQVINAFTVNETYFYREAHQFACMSRELLPALVREREAGSRVRILCIPCASGEEPYSVALWLLENSAPGRRLQHRDRRRRHRHRGAGASAGGLVRSALAVAAARRACRGLFRGRRRRSPPAYRRPARIRQLHLRQPH